MTETELLEHFKRGELKYPNFRAIANALKWNFRHDLFDALPVQCIVYQPRLKKQMVAELGARNTNHLLKSLACFANSLKTVVINLPAIAKEYSDYAQNDVSLYDFLITIVEHEYLHAYFRHTGVLISKNKIPLIRAVRQDAERYYKDSIPYEQTVEFYKKQYKKRADYYEILEEEFLIQFYTTQFEQSTVTVGTPFIDRLMDIMQDVHPYFTIAKAPKQVGKKLERITF